jgi:hypothetical protein
MTKVLADDFSQGKGAKATTHWEVQRLGAALPWTTEKARVFDDGIGFAFGAYPYSRFFLTSDHGSGLLGDLTGKTLTATFTITGTATAFTYDPGNYVPGDDSPFEKNDACPTPASVRLYFEGKHNGKDPKWTPDMQWFSTPQAYTLTSLVGNTLTLTVPLDTANWTDKNIKASDVPTEFAAAVATVSAVGVSFGGGCFLPTGAYPTDGTASFVLKSYSVS